MSIGLRGCRPYFVVCSTLHLRHLDLDFQHLERILLLQIDLDVVGIDFDELLFNLPGYIASRWGRAPSGR